MIRLVALALLSLTVGGNDAPYLALRAVDQRIVTVGERLAVSAGGLCRAKVPRLGIAVHDLSNYDGSQHGDVRRVFGLGDLPEVLVVASGSASDRAGLLPGDAIVAIDGAPPPPRAGTGTAVRTDAVVDKLDMAAGDGRVALTIERDGRRMQVEVVPQPGCATRFQQNPVAAVQSGADGRLVTVNTGIVALTASDDELAALIAHELAHNILRHQERLGRAGASMGLLASFGRSGRLIRITENEADRLSVHLMDRAGYRLDIVEPLWRKLAKAGPPFKAPTHGGIDSRIAAMTIERARIAAMKARGDDPRPAFMAADGTLPPLR